MMRNQSRQMYSLAITGYAIALLVGIAVLWQTQAMQAGFSGADESSHFLNGYFISNYLKFHFPANPLAHAVEYYIHYPKISIGHWPPAYYGFLSLLFLVVPATPATAVVINLLVSALPAAVVGGVLAYLAGVRVALAGVVIYAIAPLVLDAYSYFMLDQALAAVTIAAMVTWVAYVNRQTWARAFAFAVLFAIAVLLKGNGWLLVFVPLLQLLIGGNWRSLLAPPIYLAMAVAAMAVVPWYWVTSGISADGFNYQPGLSYAWLALSANLKTLGSNLTYTAAPLSVIGVMRFHRHRHVAPGRWQLVAGCLSLILATLALQSLVPVDIVDRYMAPALTALLVLAMLGAQAIFLYALAGSRRRRMLAIPAILVAVAMIGPGLVRFGQLREKIDLRTAVVVPAIAGTESPVVYMIDGSAGAEGGFIAEMALKDPALQSYTVRASKVFAESNFMGTSYRLKYPGSEKVLQEVQRLGIAYIVIIRINDKYAFLHSAQLAKALEMPNSNYRKSMSLPHHGIPGTTDVYQAVTPVTPNLSAVRNLGTPAKANAITGRMN